MQGKDPTMTLSLTYAQNYVLINLCLTKSSVQMASMCEDLCVLQLQVI